MRVLPVLPILLVPWRYRWTGLPRSDDEHDC